MAVTGCTGKLLRFPILLMVGCILSLETSLYVFVRFCIRASEWWSGSLAAHKHIKARMREATYFTDWCSAARDLDAAERRDEWKLEHKSPFYDFVLIQEYCAQLAAFRHSGDMRSLMTVVQTIYSTYNIAGINNSAMYNMTYFGTKELIQKFIQDLTEATILIRDSTELSLETRLDFFRRCSKKYGRTALLLSGGAANGYYHLGVIKTLFDAKCLPTVFSGASAGSLIAAYIGVRTDAELHDLFVPDCYRLFTACDEAWLTKARRYAMKGYLFDVNKWIGKLQPICGDLTFIEAYRRTGRLINIAITNHSKYVPSVLLNYKTTPNVLLWSAVLASSAFPNIISPVELVSKDENGEHHSFHVYGHRFSDGTLKADIPLKEVGKAHACNFFIVSQVNPHFLPLYFQNRGGTGNPSQHQSGSGMRGGFILSMCEKLLKLEMRKWLLLLNSFDLLPVLFGADWRFIWLQGLTGTLTIVPDAPLSSYWNIITDPTYESMSDYIRRGERATWPKLARISNHFRFERLLKECRAQLIAQANNKLEASTSQQQSAQKSNVAAAAAESETTERSRTNSTDSSTEASRQTSRQQSQTDLNNQRSSQKVDSNLPIHRLNSDNDLQLFAADSESSEDEIQLSFQLEKATGKRRQPPPAKHQHHLSNRHNKSSSTKSSAQSSPDSNEKPSSSSTSHHHSSSATIHQPIGIQLSQTLPRKTKAEVEAENAAAQNSDPNSFQNKTIEAATQLLNTLTLSRMGSIGSGSNSTSASASGSKAASPKKDQHSNSHASPHLESLHSDTDSIPSDHKRRYSKIQFTEEGKAFCED